MIRKCCYNTCSKSTRRTLISSPSLRSCCKATSNSHNSNHKKKNQSETSRVKRWSLKMFINNSNKMMMMKKTNRLWVGNNKSKMMNSRKETMMMMTSKWNWLRNNKCSCNSYSWCSNNKCNNRTVRTMKDKTCYTPNMYKWNLRKVRRASLDLRVQVKRKRLRHINKLINITLRTLILICSSKWSWLNPSKLLDLQGKQSKRDHRQENPKSLHLLI